MNPHQMMDARGSVRRFNSYHYPGQYPYPYQNYPHPPPPNPHPQSKPLSPDANNMAQQLFEDFKKHKVSRICSACRYENHIRSLRCKRCNTQLEDPRANLFPPYTNQGVTNPYTAARRPSSSKPSRMASAWSSAATPGPKPSFRMPPPRPSMKPHRPHKKKVKGSSTLHKLKSKLWGL